MMDENNSIVPSNPDLDTKIAEAANQIMMSDDPDASKEQLALFNWYLSKKNVNRVLKLNDLYDSVTDQMISRFNLKPDLFTNADLLDYVKVLQGTIATAEKGLSQVQEPPTIIQQTNTQVNINVVDTFDKDSKARILAAVQATLSRAQKSVSNEAEIKDKDVNSDIIEVTVDNEDVNKQ